MSRPNVHVYIYTYKHIRAHIHVTERERGREREIRHNLINITATVIIKNNIPI